MSRFGKILFFMSGVSLISFAIIRFMVSGWVPFLWVALSLALGFVVAGFYVDRLFFKEFLGMKTTKQGLSMGSLILMVLVFLTALNIVGARKYVTWDFSLGKVNTLSEQSVKILKTLDSDLRVIYFYKNGTEGVDQNRRMFVELIRKYQDQTGLIKLEFVEVNERPDLTEKYGIHKGTQAVILDYKNRHNLIEKIDEQELTSALVKVTREKDKKVYVLQGHRELGLEASPDGQSLLALKTLLEGNRYTVVPYSLTTGPAIPDDADVLIVAGPQQSFIDVEVRALEDYLKKGGSLIVALEPRMKVGLEEFLKRLGVGFESNYIATVLDTPMGRAIDPRFTRGSEFSKESKISTPFGKSEFVLFHLPQGIKKGQVPNGINWIDLVKTNQSAMGFESLDFEGGTPQKGPFTLGVEISGVYPGVELAGGKPFQLLVFGDSEFLNDQYLYQNLNRDLVLNSVSALAKEENLISISPKDVAQTKLELPDSQFVLYIFGFIIPLPILFFVMSGVLWMRRRNA